LQEKKVADKKTLQKNFRISQFVYVRATESFLFFVQKMLVSFNLEKLWIFNILLFQVDKDMHLCETFTIRKRKRKTDLIPYRCSYGCLGILCLIVHFSSPFTIVIEIFLAFI